MSPNILGAGEGSWPASALAPRRGRSGFPPHFLHVLSAHPNVTQVLRDFQRLQNFIFNKTGLR